MELFSAARLVLGATLVITASAPVFAQTPPVFAPSGPWAIKGDDGRCLLSRSFSDGADTLTVQFEGWPSLWNLEMSIADTHRGGRYVTGETDLRLADDKPPIAGRVFESFDSTDGVHRVHQGSVGRAEMPRIAAAGAVTFAPEAGHYVTIEMPKLGGAFAVLKQCEDALFASSGLPIEALAAMKTMPMQRDVDYTRQPVTMTRADAGDLEDVGFASITVSPAGAPTACNILHRAKSDVLNATLCEGMKHKFDPARDAAGRPVAGVVFVVERWQRGIHEMIRRRPMSLRD